MTHLMVPDGVLALWLWISTTVIAVAWLAWALWATRDSDRTRLLPLTAVLAAVMTLTMSLEIVPLGYEPHLTVLAGIVLGPAYGFLATFIFMILRLLMGDGGVTLLGLNTLLLGSEAVLGYLAFRLLTGIRLPLRDPALAGVAAGVSTILALFLATLLFLVAVALGNLDLADLASDKLGALAGLQTPTFLAFAGGVLALGAIGWVLEGIAIGAIVAFLRAVRPSLIPMARADEGTPSTSWSTLAASRGEVTADVGVASLTTPGGVASQATSATSSEVRTT